MFPSTPSSVINIHTNLSIDQSGKGNHLTQAPPGGAAQGPDVNGYDHLTAAGGAPVLLNGQRAFGVFIFPGSGYRNNNAVDTATGDEPEGMLFR